MNNWFSWAPRRSDGKWEALPPKGSAGLAELEPPSPGASGAPGGGLLPSTSDPEALKGGGRPSLPVEMSSQLAHHAPVSSRGGRMSSIE